MDQNLLAWHLLLLAWHLLLLAWHSFCRFRFTCLHSACLDLRAGDIDAGPRLPQTAPRVGRESFWILSEPERQLNSTSLKIAPVVSSSFQVLPYTIATRNK